MLINKDVLEKAGFTDKLMNGFLYFLYGKIC
nr:MAG TPA: hypothetical protein [Caudoviricetes sp.]